MVFLFSFFAFLAFLNNPESTPERLRFSEVSFSAAIQESSVRCLDPKSGQELSVEKIQEGETVYVDEDIFSDNYMEDEIAAYFDEESEEWEEDEE